MTRRCSGIGRALGGLRASAALATLACAVACTTMAPVDDRDLPTLRLKTERQRPDPVDKACKQAHEVTLVRGPVPRWAAVVARLQLTAVDRAAPLSTYESVLREWSAKHCVEGVSVLRAEEGTGHRHAVLEVIAATWTVLPAPPLPSDQVPPAPPSPEEEFWD